MSKNKKRSNRTVGEQCSVWDSKNRVETEHPLSANASADVCIIGAGIAGLTTALLLSRLHYSVVVLEADIPGAGETGRTTAHLSNVLDDGYVELERLHGIGRARLACQSHTSAITLIQNIISQEQIACEFERLNGYLFAAPNRKDELEAEYHAARRAGLSGVDWVDRAPLPLFDTGRCFRCQNQAQLHPLQYLHGLAKAVIRHGGRVFTGTRAAEIEGTSSLRITDEKGHVINSGACLIATNAPIWDTYGFYTLQTAWRSYVIGAQVHPGSVSRALYWDTDEPYHYARLAGNLLIVGGEDHRTGQTEDVDQYSRLETWARSRFPIESIARRWSGQVLEPVDRLAFIGRFPLSRGNVFIATGDSGHGMTHGAIAAMLITDLVRGKKNPWEKLYDPSRITIRAVGGYITDALNSAEQYGSWLQGADVGSVEAIQSGCGAIVSKGLSRVAAYRDESGRLHEYSAACPHLNGRLAWNKAEKSWDCPCHGSRFDCLGKVLTGPANSDMNPPGESPVFSSAGLAAKTGVTMAANAAKKIVTLRIH